MNAERLVRFLSEGTTESSRRLIAYRCAMVLLIIASALTAVVCYQGMEKHPVDNGLLTSLGAIVLIIAGLAREIFNRKPEPCPSPKPGESAPPVAALESALIAASSDTQAVS